MFEHIPKPIIVRKDNCKPSMSDIVSLNMSEIVEVTVPVLEDITDVETQPEVTFNIVKCFTVYCDSIRWDGREDTMDKSGDGSIQRPFRNARYALQQILCTLEKTCYLPMFILYITGEVNYAVSHTALCPLKYITDLNGYRHFTYLRDRDFFKKRLIISGEKADGGKLRITPEKLNYDSVNRQDTYPGNCYEDVLIYTMCVPDVASVQHIVFDHKNVSDTPMFAGGVFWDCEFLNTAVGATNRSGGTAEFFECVFTGCHTHAIKIHSCKLGSCTVAVYTANSEIRIAGRDDFYAGSMVSDAIYGCTIYIGNVWYESLDSVALSAIDSYIIVDTNITIDLTTPPGCNVFSYSALSDTPSTVRNSSISMSLDCINMTNMDDISCRIVNNMKDSPLPEVINFPYDTWKSSSYSYARLEIFAGEDKCSLVGTDETWSKRGADSDTRYTKYEYQKTKVKIKECIIHRDSGEKECGDEYTQTVWGCE